MLVLQRGNQALFADQKNLLAKIKKIKKEANNAGAPSGPQQQQPSTASAPNSGGYGTSQVTPAAKVDAE